MLIDLFVTTVIPPRGMAGTEVYEVMNAMCSVQSKCVTLSASLTLNRIHGVCFSMNFREMKFISYLSDSYDIS